LAHSEQASFYDENRFDLGPSLGLDLLANKREQLVGSYVRFQAPRRIR